MIIRRLTASFGKLKNETLRLRDGLNIIVAENEAGKSTWCAFLRAMLYGIDTSDRDKAGFLADKTRYAPWGGGPMEGEIDISYPGGDVTIRRATLGKAPMRDFSAVYTDTGESVIDLTGDNVGEKLTGVSEGVFRRSAFISQAGVRVEKNDELEKRILSLIGAGDETHSYTQADGLLRTWLRRRRHYKAGEIPAAQSRLAEIDERLDALSGKSDEAALLLHEMREHEKTRQTCEEAIRDIEKHAALEGFKRIREAKNKQAAATARVQALRDVLKNAPTRADIAEIREGAYSLAAQKAALDRENARVDDTIAELERAQSALSDAPISEENAPHAASELRRLERQRMFGKSAVAYALVAAAVALGALLALRYAVSLAIIPSAAIAVAIAAIIIAVRVTYGVRLRRVLVKYGARDLEALRETLTRLPDMQNAVSLARDKVNTARENADEMSREADATIAKMASVLDKYPELDRRDISGALTGVEAQFAELDRAEALLAAAKTVVESLPEANAERASLAETADTPPGRTREEAERELKSAQAAYADASARYNRLSGELRALGDPIVLGSERAALSARLDALTEQYAAIETAIDVLGSANAEMSSRFSPLLTNTARGIIQRLTGGRYEALSVTRDFSVSAKESDGTLPRDLLWLSAGTVDQAYLALRLALVSLILPGETRCPVICDDVLSNFDDTRVGYALEYLRDMAGERQVILFTCGGESARYFEGDGRVNTVRL